MRKRGFLGSFVSLVKVSDPARLVEAVSQGLDLAGFRADAKANSVVIKPNMCYYWGADTGQTTDPRVVSAVIDVIREKLGKDVNITVGEADASAMRTKWAFPVLGYDRLAQEKRVELVNLSQTPLVERKVHVGSREIAFEVPELLLKADLFVNVPKLKVMRQTKITCAMKNVFGAIGYRRKMVYHPFLDEAIVGINMVLKPHLTVVDGLVGLGAYPVKLGLLMAGVDVFSVDWIASQIMRYKPSSVKCLKIAVRERLGDPQGVGAVGESVAEFRNVFPKASFGLGSLVGLQTRLLKLYSRIAGDVVPPFLEDA